MKYNMQSAISVPGTYYVVSMSVLDPYHDDFYPPFMGLHNCEFLCPISQLFF